MKKKTYTVTTIINHSRDLIHMALSNQWNRFLEHVSENFVYIADYDALYSKDRDSFAKQIHFDNDQPPVTIAQEEYELLIHERSLWITFGRVVVETTLPDCSTVMTKFHFTLTLQKINGELKLIQAMACHIPDAAAEEAKRVTHSMLFGKSTAFRQIQVKQNATASRLCFHSIDGMYYYLYPNEILYFEADDHRCIVHTTDNTFACARKLQSIVQPPFYHVSKSYLVNPLYVTRIERYKATMTDGNQLPISRPKYMEFKKLLEGKDL